MSSGIVKNLPIRAAAKHRNLTIVEKLDWIMVVRIGHQHPEAAKMKEECPSYCDMKGCITGTFDARQAVGKRAYHDHGNEDAGFVRCGVLR